jgi:hypothetical protein
VLGVLILSGDQLSTTTGTSGKAPGALLCLGVVLGGYLLTFAYRTGPLHAVGIAATLLALPPFLFFSLYDSNSLPPVPLATALFVTAATWLVSYLVAPGRGHALYLGTGLIAAWLWAMEATEHILTTPFQTVTSGSLFFSPDDSTVVNVHSPDLHTLALMSFIFGIGALIDAVIVERHGYRGMATPLLFTGVVTLAAAIAFISGDAQESGTGGLAILAGLAVLLIGATSGRRLTTWAGGAGVAIGAGLLVDTLAGDSPRGAGLSLVVAGVIVVVVAHVVSTSWKEPPETTAGPSTLAYKGGSTQPAVPPPPPATSSLG